MLCSANSLAPEMVVKPEASRATHFGLAVNPNVVTGLKRDVPFLEFLGDDDVSWAPYGALAQGSSPTLQLKEWQCRSKRLRCPRFVFAEGGGELLLFLPQPGICIKPSTDPCLHFLFFFLVKMQRWGFDSNAPTQI